MKIKKKKNNFLDWDFFFKLGKKLGKEPKVACKRNLCYNCSQQNLLGFFCVQKHVISSVEMADFEINDNKPIINYIPRFP